MGRAIPELVERAGMGSRDKRAAAGAIPADAEGGMQIRVTVELVGEPEEVGILLAQIGETMIGDSLDEDLEDPEGEDTESWWTAERADAFVRELTNPALLAVSVIAQQGPRVSFRDFQRRMGMTGVQLAGRLSSIGFTVARQGTPFPFVRDYYQKVYMIDEGVAAILRDATAKELARRRDAPDPQDR